MEEVRNIPVARLRPPKVLLRPVDKHSLAFLEMKNTIEDGGLINSIAVRPTKSEGYFEIVDGMWRFTCCEMLGKETMPCIVKNLTDEEALSQQIQANAIRPETKPVEFAKQLKRIQKACPAITASLLSRKVGKSVQWIKSQLLLLDLDADIQLAVDRDEIPICNAYMLAKLPKVAQREHVAQAKSMSNDEFRRLTADVIRGVMEAIKTGKLEKWFVREFKPRPYLRPLKHIKKELAEPVAATAFLSKNPKAKPIDIWRAALTWASNLDPESIERQREAAERRQKQSTIERHSYVTELDTEVPD